MSKYKKFLCVMFALVILGAIVLNVSIKANNNYLSEIALANIEALAQDEAIDGAGICCVAQGSNCNYALIRPDSGHVVSISDATYCAP